MDLEKPTFFDVVRRMIDTNDHACKLAPLSNIDGAQWTKRGTEITIGWPTNIVSQIANGDFTGGLLLIERERFEEVKAEIQEEAKSLPNFMKLAGELHDQVHEACGLVSLNGTDVGWAPEEGIPLIAEALKQMFERGRRQFTPTV